MNTKDFYPTNFNPSDWLKSENKASSATAPSSSGVASPTSREDDAARVKALIEALQASRVDLTASYDNWLHVGFALANTFGENGRTFFHEISALSPKYDRKEADSKYSSCLRQGNGTVTIGTLFHLAKEHAVTWSHPLPLRPLRPMRTVREGTPAAAATVDKEPVFSPVESGDAGDQVFTHTFSDKLSSDALPDVLLPVMTSMDDAVGRDKMLLSSLALISGILPNVYGVYGRNVVYPPLYFVFHGPAASRKGEISSCLQLLKPLKGEIRKAYESERADYEVRHSEWEQLGSKPADRATRGPEPQEPVYRSPQIPANSSASAAYQALAANNGWGVIFETEADVLSQTLLSDYGDYSTGLRQAFHHESITMNRVRDKVHVEIDCPRLAVCLTSTKGQLPKLFPSFENGLGSRFLFYGLSRDVRWISPFQSADRPLGEVYEEIGKEILELRHRLLKLGKRSVQFALTVEQQQEFDESFSQLLQEQFSMLGDGIASFVYRMGLSTFRIAMVLSLLRKYVERRMDDRLFDDGEQQLVCNDADFRTAMTIMDTLVNHTAIIYASLAEEDMEKWFEASGLKQNAPEAIFFRHLPHEFTREEALDVAEKLNFSVRSVDRYLGMLFGKYQLVERKKRGLYCKKNLQNDLK